MSDKVLEAIRKSVNAPAHAHFEVMRATGNTIYVCLAASLQHYGLFCISRHKQTYERLA